MATGTDPIPWISIHALREEGDNAYVLWQRSDIDFYPRPPRGGRLSFEGTDEVAVIFLSTPSARRATCGSGEKQRHLYHFYPRPPRGGRLFRV